MTTSLFRQEAIAHQQEARMGDVFAVQTRSLLWITALSLALVMAVGIFLGWGEYTRKARVAGFLSPSQGMLKIFTPQAGTVIEKRVVEGQQVAAGDVLYVLSAEQASLESPDAQATAIARIVERRDSLLDELEKQDDLNRIQWQEMQMRETTLLSERLQLDQEIDVRQQRLSSAQGTLKKFQDLFAQHYVAEIQMREKQDAVLAQQGELQTLKRDRLTLERELHKLQSDIAASRYEFARQRAELDRTISSQEQELTEYQARRSIVITAPVAGTATSILLEKGQVASGQQPLLSILPAGAELQAHLLVPSRAIGFIAAGQTVALRYQAFPYQRFGSQSGQVSEVSRTMIAPGEVDIPVKLDEPAYRVVVKPDQQTLRAYRQQVPLQAGMLLDADIRLERRSLLQWVFDPLYSLAGKL